MRLVVLLLSLTTTIMCTHLCNVSNGLNEEFIREFSVNTQVCQSENELVLSNRLYCYGILCWFFSGNAVCHHYPNDTWICNSKFDVESGFITTGELSNKHTHNDIQEWKSPPKNDIAQWTIVCPIQDAKIRSRTCAMVVNLYTVRYFMYFLLSNEFFFIVMIGFIYATVARGIGNENRIYAIEAPREPKKFTDYKPNIPLDEPEENEELCCLICKDNKKTWCAQTCGHIVACNACFQDYRKRKECPLCRQHVEFWVAVRI